MWPPPNADESPIDENPNLTGSFGVFAAILAEYVNLFRTCATPTFLLIPDLIFQLPVASAYFKPFSIVDDLINLVICMKLNECNCN